MFLGPKVLFSSENLLEMPTPQFPILLRQFQLHPTNNPYYAMVQAGANHTTGVSASASAPIPDSHAVSASAAVVTTSTDPDGIAKSATDQIKVPRPANAFILYRQDNHPIVKQANPGILNNEICKLTQTKFCVSHSDMHKR